MCRGISNGLTVISSRPGPHGDHRQQPVVYVSFDLPIDGREVGSDEAQPHHPHHVRGDAVYVVDNRECRSHHDSQVPAETAGTRRFIMTASPRVARNANLGPGSTATSTTGDMEGDERHTTVE